VSILVNGKSAQALVDSGSSQLVYPTQEKVTMASSSYSSEIEGYIATQI
jgi:predicted aspartyl protease